ncbi:5'-adenylylsulfate reductase-like 4 [Diospyros lotus]|uniref:5'-adenylylsulfate reductase-like 4 n=1 Tax=Diospyros lotus TaxID=55363 RepID=UPI00224E31FF|nr:5'-adenylylsulfate reductase-like 4 [Diospyros lotus]
MAGRVWEAALVLLALLGSPTFGESVRVPPSPPVCPASSVTDSVLRMRDSTCPRDWDQSVRSIGVTEGDEVSLQRALSLIQKDSRNYVALLFYASWCPFSGTIRPTLSILSSLYPSIPHFAIEELTIRPSTLSKYGVHGFPTLFLLNSTIRMRYHGSRSLGSLVAFYNDVTGFKATHLDELSMERIEHQYDHEEYNNGEQESCPFSWARSPENLLQHETYLALATAFVLLRLLYFIFPTVFKFAQLAWRRCILGIRSRSLLEHPLAYLNRAIQLFRSLKEPCKKSNLQGGAMNAKAWASKSLVSVSFGDTSTS